MKSNNVILILVDQMRGDCLGANGNTQIMTPFLDELASESINFVNAHAANPSCIPARASILTGLPSYKTGFFGYQDGIEWNFDNTLVDHMNQSGYKTINVGKTHFYKQRNNMNFDINKLYDPQELDEGFESDYHEWLRKVAPHIEDPAKVFDCNGWPTYEWPAESFYHPTEWTMRTAINEIEKACDNPYFMQISFHRPHPPFDPPKFYYDLYDDIKIPGILEGNWSEHLSKIQTTVHGQYGRIEEKYLTKAKRAYYASITHIDYQIGRLINYLRNNNMYQNTTIIFTSDHGEMLGDHNMFRKATPFRGSIHIPFIYKCGINPNTRDTRLVTHIDILSTLISNVDKENFFESGEAINLNTKETRSHLIGEHPFDKGWNFVLTKEYKYIWDSVSGEEWVFDVVNDPRETANLITEINILVLEDLRSKLIQSFKDRKLNSFINGNNLKSGDILPAYAKPQ